MAVRGSRGGLRGRRGSHAGGMAVRVGLRRGMSERSLLRSDSSASGAFAEPGGRTSRSGSRGCFGSSGVCESSPGANRDAAKSSTAREVRVVGGGGFSGGLLRRDDCCGELVGEGALRIAPSGLRCFCCGVRERIVERAWPRFTRARRPGSRRRFASLDLFGSSPSAAARGSFGTRAQSGLEAGCTMPWSLQYSR